LSGRGGFSVRVRRNARNAVIVLPFLVIKYPRDGRILRTFREFYLNWKAFLHGLAPFTLLLGPFLVQQRVPTLLKDLPPEEILRKSREIEEAIGRLAAAGIEHRELRHPESHVGFLGDRVVFIDFDHGRLSKRSRDLNKFRAWLEGLRKALGRAPREDNHRWR